MISRDDIEALRTPLIALALSLLAAAAVVFYSGSMTDNAKRLLSQRETQLREARARIQNAGEEKEMIGRYLARYQQLARAGFVGEEQRINWLDALRLANEEARVFGVEYDISAQRPFAYAAEFDTGKLMLQESVMNLRFQLLHEEDLPRFFDALARHGGGFFALNQCVMRRARAGEAEKAVQYQPNLGAECDVRWLTVRPAPPPGKKG